MTKSKHVLFNATTGADLLPCDREIYKNGKAVVISLFGKDITERVLSELKLLGLRVDWHFSRNRIKVKTLDDPERVRAEWWRVIRENELDYHWRVGSDRGSASQET